MWNKSKENEYEFNKLESGCWTTYAGSNLESPIQSFRGFKI